MDYDIYIVIGDYLKDGHQVQVTYAIRTNYPEYAILDAYSKTCKKAGIALDDEHGGEYCICGSLGNVRILEAEIDMLEDAGVDLSNIYLNPENVTANNMVELFMRMAKAHLPDLLYLINAIKPINHTLGKTNIGYGIFNY